MSTPNEPQNPYGSGEPQQPQDPSGSPQYPSAPPPYPQGPSAPTPYPGAPQYPGAAGTPQYPAAAPYGSAPGGYGQPGGGYGVAYPKNSLAVWSRARRSRPPGTVRAATRRGPVRHAPAGTDPHSSIATRTG